MINAMQCIICNKKNIMKKLSSLILSPIGRKPAGLSSWRGCHGLRIQQIAQFLHGFPRWPNGKSVHLVSRRSWIRSAATTDQSL